MTYLASLLILASAALVQRDPRFWILAAVGSAIYAVYGMVTGQYALTLLNVPYVGVSILNSFPSPNDRN